jgi:hypothetical protein
MIVNMPTEEEMAVAQQKLAELKSQQGGWFGKQPSH